MPFTDFLEIALLNAIFTDPAYAPPSNVWIGISTTTPDDTGANFTEHSGDNYARISTDLSDWDAAVEADPSTKANAGELAFGQASAQWSGGSNFTHFGIFNASTGVELLAYGALTVPKAVENGDTAKFAAGDLVITLD